MCFSSPLTNGVDHNHYPVRAYCSLWHETLNGRDCSNFRSVIHLASFSLVLPFHFSFPYSSSREDPSTIYFSAYFFIIMSRSATTTTTRKSRLPLSASPPPMVPAIPANYKRRSSAANSTGSSSLSSSSTKVTSYPIPKYDHVKSKVGSKENIKHKPGRLCNIYIPSPHQFLHIDHSLTLLTSLFLIFHFFISPTTCIDAYKESTFFKQETWL